MHQVPSNPGVSRPHGCILSAVGCQPTAPKMQPRSLKHLVFQGPHELHFKCCRLATYSTQNATKGSWNPGVSGTPWLHFKCCRLATYSTQNATQVPWNPGVSRPHGCILSAVGCQPTAPKMQPSSLETLVFQDPMVAFKCCRLPTYSPKMQSWGTLQHLVFGRPHELLLSAVGCQPTAPLKSNHQVLQTPGVWRDHELHFKCCRLPTYSTQNATQVPSKHQWLEGTMEAF